MINLEKSKSIRGWVWDKNVTGPTAFLYLRHEGGVSQVVVKRDDNQELFNKAVSVPVESAVIINGQEIKTNRITKRYVNTGSEIRLQDIKIVKRAEKLPIQATLEFSDQPTIDTNVENRHVAIRHPRYQNIIEVRATVLRGFREFFDKLGYLEVQVPVITPGIAEGGAKLFNLKYFGQQASLTQSWQTYGEAAVPTRDKLYTVGPAFRAEQSRTKRHLAEFWQGEVEAWLDGFDQLLSLEERVVMHIRDKLLAENSRQLKNLSSPNDKHELEERLEGIKAPFERITYEQAVDRLPRQHSFKRGDDLGSDEERMLTEKSASPVFVTHYPWKVKAFYAKKDPKDPKYALSADMLASEGFGELTTGGQREESYEGLRQNAKEQELNPDGDTIRWYIDLRKYGSSPTFGFGMGIERLTRWTLKLDDIRDATLFPRSPRNRIYQ